jgi:hypothetical protein
MNDQWLHTYFDPKEHSVDPYEREEYGRDGKQKKRCHPHILRPDDNAANLPKNAGNLFQEIPNQLTAQRISLKRKVASMLEGKHIKRDKKKIKTEEDDILENYKSTFH